MVELFDPSKYFLFNRLPKAFIKAIMPAVNCFKSGELSFSSLNKYILSLVIQLESALLFYAIKKRLSKNYATNFR